MDRIIKNSSLVAILILFHVSCINAQTTSLPEFAAGTRALALGQTASTYFSDALAGSLNPASTLNAHNITASVFYSHFKTKTDYSSFGVAIPTTRIGAFGLSYYQVNAEYELYNGERTEVGHDIFNQKHFVITHARSLFREIVFGANAKYILRRFGAEDATDYIGIDIGIQYQPDIMNSLFRNVSFGISIDNLIQPMESNPNNDNLLREYRLITEKNMVYKGNTFHIVANLVAKEEYIHAHENSVALKKDLSSLKLLFGIEYARKNLFFRLGRASNSFSGGFGVRFRSLNFGYAYGSPGDEYSVANSFSLTFEY
jgi:hypothetical protein